MAAILCQSLGHICSAPCRLCGSCCGATCGALCEATSKLCSNPFCIYVTVAVALNVPPIILGVTGLPELAGGCRASSWMVANLVLCGANILAAWYIGVKATMLDDPKLRERSTTTGKAMHMLCYDPWIALYILVLLGFVIWLGVGVSWRLSGQLAENCSDSILDQTTTSVACGYSFLFLGFCALLLSLCLGACDERNNTANQPSGYYVESGQAGYVAPPANAKASGMKEKQDEAIPTALAVAM